MSEPTREQIQRRMDELWQQAGFPNGRDKEFEHQAEQELRNQECSIRALPGNRSTGLTSRKPTLRKGASEENPDTSKPDLEKIQEIKAG
jgi:hypothetical protein